MAEQTLDEVLTPLTQESFFRDIWGKNYLFQKGNGSKFGKILPWNAINKILSEHRLDHPRLRLAKDGTDIPATAFLTYQQSRRNVQIPRLRATDLTNLLRDGATLVVDAIDEVHPPLRTLAENLEKTFHEYVQVNAYAGWGATKGFDLHWDDHDVFILQVEGRKAWKIHGQSRKYPLYKDKGCGFAAPDTILWEGILEQGDLLYIPRGWWHVATAMREPTLHLTFGINNPTGIDLLNWVGEALIDCEIFRKDIPRFGCTEEQETFLNEFRDILLKKFDKQLLETFTKHHEVIARQRPSLSLPYSATAEIVPDDNSLRVRCILPRKIQFESVDAGALIEIRAIGKTWKFAAAAAPLLRTLLNGKIISLDELKKQHGKTFSPEDLIDLVRELVKEGALTLVE
jgi:ribosomal protein L16 Arg81 hydroxylase